MARDSSPNNGDGPQRSGRVITASSKRAGSSSPECEDAASASSSSSTTSSISTNSLNASDLQSRQQRQQRTQKKYTALSDEGATRDETTSVRDEMEQLFEERLRTQKKESEEKLRVQKDECEEKLRVLKEDHEEKLREQKDECEEKLRILREDYEERLRVQGETVDTLQAGMDMYGPFPLDDLPLELIALVSDFVGNVHDLASMSLMSHRLRNGVLLSQPWIVVEEIVAASNGNVEEQRRILHDRHKCAVYACEKGLLRAVRALNLSRTEVTEVANERLQLIWRTCLIGQLEVLKYLHVTYALTAEELNAGPHTPMYRAVIGDHLDVARYLHAVCGVTVPRSALIPACRFGLLEMLKYLHTEGSFTAEDVRLLDMSSLYFAVIYGQRDILVYLRTGFGLTQEDARRCLDLEDLSAADKRLVREIFELT